MPDHQIHRRSPLPKAGRAVLPGRERVHLELIRGNFEIPGESSPVWVLPTTQSNKTMRLHLDLLDIGDLVVFGPCETLMYSYRDKCTAFRYVVDIRTEHHAKFLSSIIRHGHKLNITLVDDSPFKEGKFYMKRKYKIIVNGIVEDVSGTPTEDAAGPSSEGLSLLQRLGPPVPSLTDRLPPPSPRRRRRRPAPLILHSNSNARTPNPPPSSQPQQPQHPHPSPTLSPHTPRTPRTPNSPSPPTSDSDPSSPHTPRDVFSDAEVEAMVGRPGGEQEQEQEEQEQEQEDQGMMGDDEAVVEGQLVLSREPSEASSDEFEDRLPGAYPRTHIGNSSGADQRTPDPRSDGLMEEEVQQAELLETVTALQNRVQRDANMLSGAFSPSKALKNANGKRRRSSDDTSTFRSSGKGPSSAFGEVLEYKRIQGPTAESVSFTRRRWGSAAAGSWSVFGEPSSSEEQPSLRRRLSIPTVRGAAMAFAAGGAAAWLVAGIDYGL